MKILSVGIAAIILPYLLSDLKILHAADSNKNTDDLLLKASSADDIPEFSTSDESYDYAYEADRKAHGGKRNLLFGVKKAKRVEAELNNLLETTADVQTELAEQGAMQMRLNKELEQQKLSRIPQKNIHYHYEFQNSSDSKDQYNSAHFSQSKAPYLPPAQRLAVNNFMPLRTQPVIDFYSKDYLYSSVASPIYGSKDSYALPEAYESSASKGAVKNVDAYYKDLWNLSK